MMTESNTLMRSMHTWEISKVQKKERAYGGVVETTYARSLLRACYRLKKLGPICSKSI